MNRKNNRRENKTAVRLIGYILVAVICIGVSIPFNFNDHHYTITVTDKERVVAHASSKYMVFGDDKSGDSLVFQNTDAFLRLKFDSSNIQGELKENHTYDITVVGVRIPFFSFYENIIGVSERK